MGDPERRRPTLHGFLVIDKPAGWTSHDVVARARRLLGERRIGHAGTLDPAATGVLPLAVGLATRALEYLADSSKTYLAEVVFGVETDSLDGDGTVTATSDPSGLSRAEVERALASFRGPLDQVPPMHSAIKVGGRPLYERARRGEELELAPRRVTIHELALLEWEPPVARLLVDCSKGTYVRSLARDLGRALGVGGYLGDLVRVRSGPFTLCDAWTLAELSRLDVAAWWPEVAYHPDVALLDRPALLLDGDARRVWRHGGPVPATGADGIARVYDEGGSWLGVARGEAGGGAWRPLKVIEEQG
jgi:tRNA pseudouridine55 synthase